MSQLISEINRYRNLMGLQELNEVLLTNKNNKNLLVESSIKAKFNFPKVEFKGKKIDSFDQLKNYAISKGITDIGLKNSADFDAFKSAIPDLEALSKRFEVGGAYRNFLENNYILRKADPTIVGTTGDMVSSIKRRGGKGKFGVGTERQQLLDDLGPDGADILNWDNTFGFRDQLLWAYRQTDPKGFEALLQKYPSSDAAILKKSVLDSEIPDKPVVDTKALDNNIKSKTDPATGQKYKPKDVKEKWKEAGGDETKLDIAWNQRGWIPGKKVPNDLKVKGTPTPAKQKVGGFEEGTIGYKISSETDPKTGKPYKTEDVKNEFGSTGAFEDNTLLNGAWEEGWRPGMEVPEKYQTDFYKFKQSQKSVNNRPEVKVDTDLRTLIEGPDKKKPLHNHEKVYDEFGVDEGNIDHMDKLRGAWEKGWRPGKRIDGEFSEFKIKDTDKVCRRLITDPNGKNNIDPKTSKPYDYEKVKEEFGSNGINPDHNKKLYEAWEEGWRPGMEVPEKYQTDLYKAAKQGNVSIPFPDVTPKTRNWFQLVYDKVKSHMWGRSLGQLEDLTYAFTNNPRTLSKFEDAVKGYINKWVEQGKNKSRGDLSWIREEFLKIQRNENLKNEISLDTLDQIKTDLKLEIKNDIRFQNDALKIKNLESTVDEFFTELIGEKGIDGSLAWVFENSKKMDSYADFGKNGIWKVFLYGVNADIPSGGKAKFWAILKNLLYRAWTTVVGGSVWSSKEALLIRNAGNFNYKTAAIQFGLRTVFIKVIVPGLFISSLQYLWQSIFNAGQSLGGNYSDKESKSFLEFAWQNILEEWSADGTKSNLGEAAWGIIKAITPGDLESIVENVVSFVNYWKEDKIKDQYKIRYEDPTLGWISYPKVKDVYESFEDVQEKIKELESSGVKKICDATDYKKNTTLEPLLINANVKVVCPGSTEKTYNIVNDKCVDPGDGTGEFKNILNCETQRNLRNLKHTCKDGTCVQDDNGEYANFVTCKASSANNDGKCKSKDKEENQTTVTPGQTVEYLADFLSKNAGLSGNKIFYSEQPSSVNYKNNKVWSTDPNDKKNYFLFSIDSENKIFKKVVPIEKFTTEHLSEINDPSGWLEVPIKESINKIIKNILSSNMKIGKRRIFEQEDEKRFGENKYDHLYDAFTFEKYDEKTGEFKEIETDSLKHGKIKERFNDFIKRYDTDDAFVRAVVDTHDDIVRIKYLKDQANISEAYLPTGLALVLNVIRESKGEYEIFSVSRSNGNWHLVKGDFKQKEMSKMQLTKQIPPEKQPKKKENGVESLKKKEQTGINLLNQDEKKGLVELPSQVKRKLLEKLRRGWSTEKPYDFFNEFYSVSDINTVFNDKIKIYKLNPTKEFFDSLVQHSPRVFIRKGFCKTLKNIEDTKDTGDDAKKVLNHILQKCETKFKGEYGVKLMKTN